MRFNKLVRILTEENERPKIGIYINNDGKKKFMAPITHSS